MAGVWIEAHQAVARHPKIKRAARRLDVDRITMIGHILCMWWWAVDYAPEGAIDDADLEDVCDEIDWEGDPRAFAEALADVGLLDKRDGMWVIHDWHEHGGKATAQSRELAAERGRYGAHRRYHVKAKDPRDDCKWCQGAPPPEDPDTPLSRDPIGGAIGDPSSPPIGKTGQDITGQDIDNPSSSEASGSDTTGYVCTVNACRCDDPDIRALTRDVARLIRANGHKVPAEHTKANHDWRAAIDKLLRIDDADADEVLRVAKWATSDQFWMANIASTPKFRDQYSKLRLRANGQQQIPTGTGGLIG